MIEKIGEVVEKMPTSREDLVKGAVAIGTKIVANKVEGKASSDSKMPTMNVNIEVHKDNSKKELKKLRKEIREEVREEIRAELREEQKKNNGMSL